MTKLLAFTQLKHLHDFDVYPHMENSVGSLFSSHTPLYGITSPTTSLTLFITVILNKLLASLVLLLAHEVMNCIYFNLLATFVVFSFPHLFYSQGSFINKKYFYSYNQKINFDFYSVFSTLFIRKTIFFTLYPLEPHLHEK